jgi:hypothetical protein
MKQTRGKTEKRIPKRSGAVEETGKNVSLEELRRKIADQVAAHALQMVGAIIDQVKEGEYQPLKFLFEMIGLYPAAGPEENVGEDSLARTLLRRLDLPLDAEKEAAIEAAVGAGGGLG